MLPQIPLPSGGVICNHEPSLVSAFRIGSAIIEARRQIPTSGCDLPPQVRRTEDGYEVVGFASVAAKPHRTDGAAMAIAARIALKPLVYLPLCVWLSMPGVRDTRVTFGKVVRHG